MKILLTPRSLFFMALIFLGECLLLKLGFWQLSQMEKKRAQEARLEHLKTAFPVEFQPPYENLLWQKVRLEGVFRTKRQKLLINQTLEARRGVRVLTPLMLDDGHWVLVDRGWVEQHGADYPDVSGLLQEGRVVLEGFVRPFEVRQGWLKGPVENLDGTLMLLDKNAFSIENSLPVWVQVTAGSPAGLKTGLVLNPFLTAQRHWGYMLTWFTLAGIILVFFVFWLGSAWRREAF